MDTEPQIIFRPHSASLLMGHVNLTTKYRAGIMYGTLGSFVESAIRNVCYRHDIRIVEIKVNIDHVHILVQYPPRYSHSYMSNLIKGGSSFLIRNNFPCLKLWCEDSFWSGGTYHDSVGHDWRITRKYIQHQKIPIPKGDVVPSKSEVSA